MLLLLTVRMKGGKQSFIGKIFRLFHFGKRRYIILVCADLFNIIKIDPFFELKSEMQFNFLRSIAYVHNHHLRSTETLPSLRPAVCLIVACGCRFCQLLALRLRNSRLQKQMIIVAVFALWKTHSPEHLNNFHMKTENPLEISKRRKARFLSD